MVVILTPDKLRNPEHPPIQAMIDGVENLCAAYVATWRTFPRYCYMNTTLWEDVQEGMWDTLYIYNLTPVTTHTFPYGRISVHHDYHDPDRIAKWHKQFDDEQGEDSGKLEVV